MEVWDPDAVTSPFLVFTGMGVRVEPDGLTPHEPRPRRCDR